MESRKQKSVASKNAEGSNLVFLDDGRKPAWQDRDDCLVVWDPGSNSRATRVSKGNSLNGWGRSQWIILQFGNADLSFFTPASVTAVPL